MQFCAIGARAPATRAREPAGGRIKTATRSDHPGTDAKYHRAGAGRSNAAGGHRTGTRGAPVGSGGRYYARRQCGTGAKA